MDKKDLKELYNKCFGKNKDDRYHAIAMLGIYGVFILILIIMIRVSPAQNQDNNQSNKSNNNISNDTSQKTDNKNNSNNTNTNQGNITTQSEINYSYVYTIDNSGIKEVVTGKRVDDKEIFTLITDSGSKDYAKLSDNYLEKVDGSYHLVESPSSNLVYTNLDTIIELTEKGSLTTNNNTYVYTIPTNEILKAFNYTSEVSETITDTITITTENTLIKYININFTNYRTIINNNNLTNLNINMEFNNLGTTKDFNITVSN